MRRRGVVFLLAGLLAIPGIPGIAAQATGIAARLKPEVLRRAVDEREIMASARLESIEPKPARSYEVYATMLVRSGEERVRRVLTDYRLYKELIPYVEEASFSPETRVLALRGGIWKFRMASRIRFDDRAADRISYEVVGGSFEGMKGEILFERSGERGTLVYLDGKTRGIVPGPAFVLERGAEIVFAFAARRMRSYIESQEDLRNERRPDPSVPQPRRSL